MPYREKPEKNGADWRELVLQKLAGRSDAEYFAELADSDDNYRAEVLSMIGDDQIADLMKLYKAANSSAQRISYYHFYRLALGKIITEVIDLYPESFGAMEESHQELVLSMKLETPNLQALDGGVFAYLDGRMSLPNGTIVVSRDFESWLRDLSMADGIKIAALPHVSRIFDEYRSYCLRVFGRGV